MNRTKQITVAAILAAIVALLSLASGGRILTAGSEGMLRPDGSPGGPPFWAGLMFFFFGAAGLFGAYGVWRNQRWGKVTTIVLVAINGLFGLGDLVGSASRGLYAMTAVFVVGELVAILIIVLLLQRPRAAVTA